jgi:hypothetical protein
MRSIAVLLAFLILHSPAGAAPPLSVTWEKLSPLVLNRSVEVVQHDGTIHKGEVLSVSPAAIEITSVSIPREKVQKLYVSRGRGAARTAALVAAVAGTGVLAVIGILGAALDAKDAAIGGFVGAAGAGVAATLLAVKGDRKPAEIIIVSGP